MVVALLGAWMAHAQQTKTLYGQTYTREEFEELKESIRPKPGWKAGEAGVRERIEELKRRSAGQEAEYSRQPAFDEKASLAVIPRLKQEAASFHVHRGTISLLLDPEPLMFGSQLQVSLVSAVLRGAGKQKLQVKDLQSEYWSWSRNGVSKGRYAFELPVDLEESDITSGEAVFELSLPKGFETVVLTKEHPKASGFELVELGSHFVRIKYDRPDESKFLSEVRTRDGKPLAAYELGEGQMALLGELVKKKWEELPANLPFPSTGTIDLGFVGPATQVLLYKPAADKKHRVKSVWKKLP